MLEENEIHVRMAVLTDALQLAKVGEQTFFDTYSNYNTPANMQDYIDNNFTTNILESELSNNDTYFMIAEKNNAIIGYMKLNRLNNAYIPEISAMEIARFYVDRAFRQLNVGKQLLAAAEKFTKSARCDAFWLGVWEKNTHAIAVYKHWGFNIVGTTTFKLGSDVQQDFIMVKMLTH